MSLPSTNLANLQEKIRFVAPRLTSLIPGSVASFIQEVVQYTSSTSAEASALPRVRAPTPSTSDAPNETLRAAEKLIADAAKKFEIPGFDQDTFAPMWSAAKKVALQEAEASAMSSSLLDGLNGLSLDLVAPSFSGDPPAPENFHKYILPKVLSLIRLLSPSSLSSQEDLWNFLLSTTRAQNASEARRLVSSLNMNGPHLHSLNAYLEQLRSVVSRCQNFICLSRSKIIVEAFLKGLKPTSLRNSLFDEHRLTPFQDLDSLISRTLFLHQNSILSESTEAYNPNHPKNTPRNYSRNVRRNPQQEKSTNPTFESYSFSNASSQPSCNFCKQPGHLIRDCPDPACKRSSISNPKGRVNFPRNPRYPRPTADNSSRHVQGKFSKTNQIVEETEEANDEIEFDLEVSNLIDQTLPDSDCWSINSNFKTNLNLKRPTSDNSPFLLKSPNAFLPTPKGRSSLSGLNHNLVSVPEEVTSPLRRNTDPSYGFGQPHVSDPILDTGANDGKVENLDPEPKPAGSSIRDDFLSMTVLVNKTPLTGTWDCASQTSCISEDLSLKANLPILPSKINFRLANGSSVKSPGCCTTIITFNFESTISKVVHVKCTLHIIPGKNQFLLGCDLMKNLGLLKNNGLMINLNKEHSAFINAEACLDGLILRPRDNPCQVNSVSRDWTHEARFELNHNQISTIKSLLFEFQDIFGKPHPDGVKWPPMTLPFFYEKSVVNFPARNLNPHKLQIANDIFDELIADNFAFESPKGNPFSSPICLVTYPDDRKPRLTGDFSGVNGINALTIPLEANLPRISDISAFLSNATFIATLDLPKAFWQILLDPKDQMKTTLAIPGRNICFKRAAFGLKNVPAYFQNIMDKIFSMPNVFIYIDDVIIAHNDFKVFTDTLKEIFKRARKHRIRFGIRKCSFVTKKSKIKVLGAIFQDGKRSIDPDRIEAIANLPIPTTISELRSFCGSINYLRDWIPNLSQLIQPLTNLTRKDPETRLTISKKWTDAHTKNFIEIKRLISNSVDLALPDDESTIIISTDASDKAISGIIWKKLDNSDPHEPLEDQKLAPISFFYKTLSDTQSNWPIIQKELFAIVCTLNQPNLSSFLISKRLIIFCDHRNIVYLINHPDKNRIVTRWIPLLSNFDIEIVHVEGSRNSCADLLSRCFAPNESKTFMLDSLTPNPDKDDCDGEDYFGQFDMRYCYGIVNGVTKFHKYDLRKLLGNPILEKIRTAQQIDLQSDSDLNTWNDTFECFFSMAKYSSPNH
ncbi:hypothetical protein GEMRC1_009586 [Eukaryota sp. GEM-RC1]